MGHISVSIFFLRNEELENKYSSIVVQLFGSIVNFFFRLLKKFICIKKAWNFFDIWPMAPSLAGATIFYAFQRHKKGRNERLFDTMFKHFYLMSISVRSAKIWKIFLRKNKLIYSIIINQKTTSWLVRCKLICCLGCRSHRTPSPLLLTSGAFGRFCLLNPPLLSGTRPDHAVAQDTRFCDQPYFLLFYCEIYSLIFT